MFIPVTIITLWLLLIYGTDTLEHSIPAHNVTTFAIFWPAAFQGWVLWVLWAAALLSLCFSGIAMGSPSKKGSRKIKFPASLSEVGNMWQFDWVLIGVAIILAISGWFTGTAATLLFGSIIALGLGLNKIEHWLV